jgi:hypothetical protein
MNARGIKRVSAQGTAKNLKIIRKGIDPEMKDLSWWKRSRSIFKLIKDSPLSTRRTRVKSLLVLAAIRDDEPTRMIYLKRHKELTAEMKAWLSKQKKSPAQSKNWVEASELRALSIRLLIEAKRLDDADRDLTANEFVLYQRAVAYALYLAHPIRNVFGGMKFMTKARYDRLEEKDPELQANLMVMNDTRSFIHLANYKTVKALGLRKIKMSRTIHWMLMDWRQFNQTDSLFVSKRSGTVEFSPMSSHNFGRYISGISKRYLGKPTGTSLIRHILITDLHKARASILEEQKQAKEIEDTYLHSEATNKEYQKND